MSWLRSLMALLALALAFPAAAVDENDLLPVDQAYVLSASAPSRDRIELRWKIHDGYYLYRHRTSATATGFTSGPLQLPPGTPHEDEFFGKVETYRGELLGALTGTASADTVTLKVKYQGCADAGICYPPQTRTLTVALPPA
ncbi:MAG TPA: protein-disulfide reductase DsbD domain-containing protein, partial [Pseudoxanthomonas sp.]|nr:protein-disulfide reductase DsbD domain-containing protein [Pseudoxanthomonas sp.]